MKQERTLVVLAAGLGSRFAGGIKQLQSVGPSGEVIMDYSIHDAIEAGFNRVIFIIRHDIEELFDRIMGDRIRAVCAKKGVEVLCAYQEKNDLPGGFRCPAERVKPWGTGHALLSCKGMLHGGFAVINADDYYGKDAFRRAMEFLDSLEEGSEGTYGLIGFRLGNTLSEHGGVTRGLCRTEDGWLTHIVETKNVIKTQDGARAEVFGEVRDLSPDIPVSMNMWGFTPDVLDKLEDRFIEFLGERVNEPKSEFLIPSEMGLLLCRGEVRIRVLPTTSHWFGMTFAEDMPGVRDAFRVMTEDAVYTTPLF
ncbi:MAG: nucleotidyltransferase [Oscillospiraceae bacterium]|nr:nucleotidyltransferase [Oscillospiraceae bacterium]